MGEQLYGLFTKDLELARGKFDRGRIFTSLRKDYWENRDFSQGMQSLPILILIVQEGEDTPDKVIKRLMDWNMVKDTTIDGWIKANKDLNRQIGQQSTEIHNLKQEILRLQSTKDQEIQVGDNFVVIRPTRPIVFERCSGVAKYVVQGERYGHWSRQEAQWIPSEVAEYIESLSGEIRNLKAEHNDRLQEYATKQGIAEKERDDALAKLAEFQRPLKVGDRVIFRIQEVEEFSCFHVIKEIDHSLNRQVYVASDVYPDYKTWRRSEELFRILDNQTVIGPLTLNAIHEDKEEEQANDAQVEAIDQAYEDPQYVLDQELSWPRSQREKFKCHYEMAKKEVARLRQFNEELSKRLADVSLERDRLKEMNDRQLKTIANCMETEKGLRKELESTRMAMSSEIESLKEKLAEDARKNVRLSQMNTLLNEGLNLDHDVEISKREKTIKELNTENGKLRSENQRLVNRMTWMNGQWVGCLNRIEELRSQYDQRNRHDHDEIVDNFPVKHDFYKTGDSPVPTQILDNRGEVVLQMCKLCGAAENEIVGPYCLGQSQD